MDNLTKLTKAVESRLKRLNKKKTIGPGVEASALESDLGFELTIVANGAESYWEDGFETEEEALKFAEAIAKKKGLIK